MLGGPLCSSICTSNGNFVLAFGSSLYNFNASGNRLSSESLHQQNIIHLHQQSRQIISIDKAGVINVSEGGKVISTFHMNTSVSQAYYNGQNVIFTSQNKLFYYNTKLKKPQPKLKYSPVGEITFLSITERFVLLGEANQLHIFSIQQGKLIKTITHKSVVKCADVWGNDLALGDKKGRIYIHTNGVLQQTQHIRQRHWHTGRVNSVILRDGNMISAGEEGVVVFWHFVTQKKDFLPRLGSQIVKISLSQDNNHITCFLSDNTAKIVLLNKDKQVVHFKTVINPHGVKTKRSQIQDYKFSSGAYLIPSQKVICLNSTPGKLQFISLNSSSFEIDITNRNATSRLDDQYPNPIEVKCFAFNSDASLLAVYADNTDISYMKIYQRNNQSYELITRINNPHKNEMIQLISYECNKQMTTKFVSIGVDRVLKIWKSSKSKKKSLKQNQNQVIWLCQSKFQYRNRQFISIQSVSKTSGNSVAITLSDHHVILLNIDNGQIQQQIMLQSMDSCYYIDTLLAYSTPHLFAICDYTKKNNLFTLQTLIKKFSVCPDNKHIAVSHEHNGNQIVTLLKINRKDIKVQKSYKIKNSQTIQSFVWYQSTPIAVTSNLYLIQFGKSSIFNETRQQQMQSEEVNESDNEDAGIDFLRKYQSIVNRKLYSAQVQKQVNELNETIKQLPHIGNRFRLLTDILL